MFRNNSVRPLIDAPINLSSARPHVRAHMHAHTHAHSTESYRAWVDSLVPTGTLRSLSVTSPGFTFRDEDVSVKRFIWINKLHLLIRILHPSKMKLLCVRFKLIFIHSFCLNSCFMKMFTDWFHSNLRMGTNSSYKCLLSGWMTRFLLVSTLSTLLNAPDYNYGDTLTLYCLDSAYHNSCYRAHYPARTLPLYLMICYLASN